MDANLSGEGALKVEVTIRCNRCDAIETVVTESWALLKTSCGCEGPYRVVERKVLPEEPLPAEEKSGNNKGEGAAGDAPQSATAEQKD